MCLRSETVLCLPRRLMSSALGPRERSARYAARFFRDCASWADGRVSQLSFLQHESPSLQARRAVGLCPSHADAPPPGSSAPGPQANTAAASANTHAPVEVLVSDAEILELPRASLDLITCSASLPYMYDPEGAVRRWREWLGPGGRLLVNVFRVGYDHGG